MHRVNEVGRAPNLCGSRPCRDLPGDASRAGQLDALPETVHDGYRCGAAAATAAALIGGPRSTSKLISALGAGLARPHQGLLEAIRRDADDGGVLTQDSVHRLADVVMEQFGMRDGTPLTSEGEFIDMLRAAGFQPTGRGPLARLFSAGPNVRATANDLAPGQAFGMLYRIDAKTLHIVLVGRDVGGARFIFDSQRSPSMFVRSDAPAEFDAYFDKPDARTFGGRFALQCSACG